MKGQVVMGQRLLKQVPGGLGKIQSSGERFHGLGQVTPLGQ
jgi:hypothetical protein